MIKRILISGILIMFLLVTGGCTSNHYEIIKDIQNYGFEGFKGYSNLNIFPEEISDNASAIQYLNEYEDQLFDPYYQIYLSCTYTQEHYLDEIERLSEIQEEYKGEVHDVKYNTNDFIFPAYVSIFADDHCYEYALVDSDNLTIHYVYTQFAKEKDIKFDLEYLPVNYMEESDNGFSIYKFAVGDGINYISNEKYKTK